MTENEPIITHDVDSLFDAPVVPPVDTTDEPAEIVWAGVKANDVLGALQEAWGNDAPKTIEELGAWKDARAKAVELEAKANNNPFASPLVKDINDILANGGNAEMALKYLDLQTKDIAAIDSTTLAEMALAKSYPNASAEDLKAILVEKFGTEEARTTTQKLELNTLVENQRKELEVQRTEMPKNVVDQQALVAADNAAYQSWGKVAERLITETKVIPISFAEAGAEFEFPLNTKERTDAMKEITAQLNEFAMASYKMNLLSFDKKEFTEKGRPMLEQAKKQLIWGKFGPEIAEAAARDAAAKAILNKNQNRPQGNPIRPNVDPPVVPQGQLTHAQQRAELEKNRRG